MLSMKAFPMRAHRCFTISTLLKTHSRHSSNIGVSSLPRFYSSQDKTSDSSTEGSSNPAPNTTSTTTTPSTEENVKIATNSKQIRRNEYVNQVDSLLQAHQVNQAVELFLANVDEYRPPPRLYDELINDCLDSHKAEKAYQIYRKQSERNFKIPSSTIEGLILQCDQMSARSKKLKNLRKTMAVIGLKPNAQLYNAMIRCYIGDDQWKVGLSLADAAVSSGFAFDDETMNYLLAAYGRVGNDGFYQALEMWHEMQRKQSRVTTFGMNGLLRSIRHCEHFDMTKMLETLERITATTAIENGNSQGNGGILGENEIFEEKLSKNENSEENSIEMKNSEENSIEIENSEETPKKSEIVAPVNTTNGDQNPIKDDGRPDLLADPRKIGRLFPLGSVSKPEHILLVLGGFSGILREMKLKSIVPNEETILTLLAIAPNSTPVEEKIHNLMKQHKVDSNEEQFLEVLLQRRCMRQDFKATLDVIDAMRSVEIKVDMGSYGMLALACKSGHDAEKFFEEIAEFNITINSVIVDAMLKNATKTRNNNYVIQIIRSARTNNIEPSAETIQILRKYQENVAKSVKVLHRLSKHERNECFKLLREMKQYYRQFHVRVDDVEWAEEDEDQWTRKEQ